MASILEASVGNVDQRRKARRKRLDEIIDPLMSASEMDRMQGTEVSEGSAAPETSQESNLLAAASGQGSGSSGGGSPFMTAAGSNASAQPIQQTGGSCRIVNGQRVCGPAASTTTTAATPAATTVAQSPRPEPVEGEPRSTFFFRMGEWAGNNYRTLSQTSSNQVEIAAASRQEQQFNLMAVTLYRLEQGASTQEAVLAADEKNAEQARQDLAPLIAAKIAQTRADTANKEVDTQLAFEKTAEGVLESVQAFGQSLQAGKISLTQYAYLATTAMGNQAESNVPNTADENPAGGGVRGGKTAAENAQFQTQTQKLFEDNIKFGISLYASTFAGELVVEDVMLASGQYTEEEYARNVMAKTKRLADFWYSSHETAPESVRGMLSDYQANLFPQIQRELRSNHLAGVDTKDSQAVAQAISKADRDFDSITTAFEGHVQALYSDERKQRPWFGEGGFFDPNYDPSSSNNTLAPVPVKESGNLSGYE